MSGALDPDGSRHGPEMAVSGRMTDSSPPPDHPFSTLATPAMTIRRWILADHRDLVAETQALRSDVVGTWDERWTSDPRRVVKPLRHRLDETGLEERYVTLLEALRARYTAKTDPPIVPAPPYVVVTSRGPLLRLTAGSERLLVRFVLFVIDRASGTRYRPSDRSGRNLVEIEIAGR